MAWLDEYDNVVFWTIYDRPRDIPGAAFVLRRWYLTESGESVPEMRYQVASSIEGIRAKLPPGLHRLPPYVDDDPVIVETWI